MTRTPDDQQLTECESEFLRRDLTTIGAVRRPLTPTLIIYRAIPQKALRMVGPWCFVDHFGPVAPTDYQNFDVAPHPHIGLQTITWLFSGELRHLDSLGYDQDLCAGQLNLMTAGHGISHAEIASDDLHTDLHGLQLWSALPPESENVDPSFEHISKPPQAFQDEIKLQLLVGQYGADEQNLVAAGRIFHPSIAMVLSTPRAASTELSLEPEFEHALYVAQGNLFIHQREGKYKVDTHHLAYLGADRSALTIELSEDAKVLLIGGKPFSEPVTMWWNYVSHDVEHIREADANWRAAAQRFGRIEKYRGERLLGPELPEGLR